MAANPTDSLIDVAVPNLSGELLDALIEAIVFPPDPRERSALICRLVQEIAATVEWRREGDEDSSSHEELTGIRRLVTAAHDHHQRMTAASADQTGSLK